MIKALGSFWSWVPSWVPNFFHPSLLGLEVGEYEESPSIRQFAVFGLFLLLEYELVSM